MSIWVIRILAVGLAFAALPHARSEQARPGSPLGGGSLLHAHNCYPEDGRWLDRIDRALATGLPRVAIEQDLAWAPPVGGRPGRSVVSHDTELAGTEPTLDQHFFARVRPLMERALAENRRDQWPLLILHLDFKSNERAHHQAVWDLLVRHRSWLTTAERVADPARVMPFETGPLLVLTENGDGQEAAFSDRVLVGDRLLIFGTTPSPDLPRSEDPATRAQIAATASPADLIPWPATNYRRWTNFAWNVVERGGQARAGEWTADEASRLGAIVRRAHAQGLWVRFYTLNGHDAAATRGWTASYNFGSPAAVQARWRAAIDAGVDFVATDQYEDFARMLPGRDRRR
jgi:glycerophosphoryl diester phosphodiesterase